MQEKLAVTVLVITLALIGLVAVLYNLIEDKNEEYTQIVLNQHSSFDSRTIPYRRGDIVDRNGTYLATSEKVYNLILDPNQINKAPEKYLEPTVQALCEVFGYDRQTVLDTISKNSESYYVKFARQLSVDEKEAFEEMMNIQMAGLAKRMLHTRAETLLIGVSGGLDSTVSAVLLVDALGKENVYGVSMPSKLTSDESKSDARILAENLGIGFSEVSIKEMYETTDSCFNNLFDEVEKAHTDVFNILLQVLDDGRITDAQGRVVNFENTIIVMTSNAGSEGRVGGLGFGRSEGDMVKEKTMKALREFLRPEFINRVDEIITFNHLTEENFRGIADIMLSELKDALSGRGLELAWGEDLREYLVKKAYSITYGARNLRRTIQRDLEDPISEAIIDSFEEPISKITVRIADDALVLDKK